jgi:hypothetical protein
MVNVGREAMLAIGCIQAQRCHTGSCPTGVATQSKWLMHGLDPDVKHARAANYVRALRGELLSLSRALGVPHPALVDPDQVEIVSERYRSARCARSSATGRTGARTTPPPARRSWNSWGSARAAACRARGGPVLGDESGAGLERETDLPDASGSAMGRAGD